MKTVITGAAGLLGWHLQCHLSVLDGWKDTVVALNREAFNDDAVLEAALANADVVVHLAGINRADDAVLEEGNIALAERLVAALDRVGAEPHLLYSNTIHKTWDNAYGRGKAGADRVFRAWSEVKGSRYSDLVLPHVFGEGGRPFYNSAVFTFCQQIVEGESLSINAGGMLELLHAQDICSRIVEAVERKQTGELRLKGRAISAAEVAGKLAAMHASYTGHVVPDLRDSFDLQLFNTLRSFLYPAHYPCDLTLHTDNRGSLFEAVKADNGGQAFLSTTKPGITRGNHFHFGKVERFLVIRGEAIIRLRRLFSDEVTEFRVSGDAPVYIDMPTLHTHSITNVGEGELMTLFWSHEIFDPEAPDTYFLPVVQDQEN
ncbi:capsular polysaccharide biosynthesis protein CapF [Alcanivorax sp. P2S70]|uniref:polysaccharide biosynthesis C-terminal domain-containing protein n=1 Tax=Alcanivorax sp. P2S70 TaxID=1397527 RepID=UPI0003B5290E|nr:NAD-dependent epimerase/dehydratase family protein [Alcanivorax sp. P2S70]ERP91177.1 capsular polysaccharide biosynthesis protein CapF [Alcanivorax sp. P2S70]